MSTRPRGTWVPRTRGWGLFLAFTAACLSGVAVFVNGEYVGKVGDPTVYTTAKNAVAALVLLACLTAGRPATRQQRLRRLGARGWAGLLALGVVGGSVPFVLFFEGLARTASPVQAGFVHKTLVVWVALLAVPCCGSGSPCCTQVRSGCCSPVRWPWSAARGRCASTRAS